MSRPIISPEDAARERQQRMAIRLVPIMHYQAVCAACGWSGTEWNNRADADEDVRSHRCRRRKR